MKTFRYNLTGTWFKGNPHLHSTASDGGMNFAQLAELYTAAGYHFLFRTDHWVASDTSQDVDDAPLLWLDGMEMDGKDASGAFYHVVCLGKVRRRSGDGSDYPRQDGLETGLQTAQQQGALLILAHPHWTGNTLEDVLRHPIDGVEVYNHVCHWLNGKSNGLVHWEALLRRNPQALALAVDDGHLRPEHPGWNGGWIVVNAAQCTTEAILAGIQTGNFYASCGPDFHNLQWDGERIHVQTSPVQFIRLVGPNSEGQRVGSFDGQVLTEASFTAPAEWPYAYLEIEDARGKRAWTNGLFR
jgi:hypothetical protein